MNTLPIGQAVSPGGDKNAGAVAFGGPQQSAPANFQVGAVGFGPSWDEEPGLRDMYDQACRTIVRMECEAEENKAQLATYEVERGILEKEMRRLREKIADQSNTIEGLRDSLCSYKCADKAAADGGWANI